MLIGELNVLKMQYQTTSRHPRYNALKNFNSSYSNCSKSNQKSSMSTSKLFIRPARFRESFTTLPFMIQTQPTHSFNNLTAIIIFPVRIARSVPPFFFLLFPARLLQLPHAHSNAHTSHSFVLKSTDPVEPPWNLSHDALSSYLYFSLW